MQIVGQFTSQFCSSLEVARGFTQTKRTDLDLIQPDAWRRDDPLGDFGNIYSLESFVDWHVQPSKGACRRTDGKRKEPKSRS